jgi:hypothetical protein
MRTAAALILGCLGIASPVHAQTRLSDADEAAAFRSAGFKKVGSQWRACGDPGTAGYTSGQIESVEDLNSDGRPEAIISEGSTYCYGAAEAGYAIVSKQADGQWKLVTKGPGMVTALRTKGAGGWADLEIGGPGFCFPVHRWNGSEYKVHRFQYEGKPCR